MRVKLLLFTPERIIYDVIYQGYKPSKLVMYRALTFMCINRVVVMKETFDFRLEKYKGYHIPKWC